MAHSGKLWPVQQFARAWSGQSVWPNYPAKRYIFDCEGWIGTALHPTPTTAIAEFVGSLVYGEVSWLTEDLGPAGQVTIMGLTLRIPSPPSELLEFQMSLTVDGIEQYLVPSFWVPFAPFGVLGWSADPAFMAPGWTLQAGGFCHFTAEPWP